MPRKPTARQIAHRKKGLQLFQFLIETTQKESSPKILYWDSGIGAFRIQFPNGSRKFANYSIQSLLVKLKAVSLNSRTKNQIKQNQLIDFYFIATLFEGSDPKIEFYKINSDSWKHIQINPYSEKGGEFLLETKYMDTWDQFKN